jgi:serine/threonine protein kinase
MAPHPSPFGPYELIRRLGAGGMAETYLALRRGPGGFEQRVCLKRILQAYESDTEFVRMFLQEARLSARLRHANIVQVLDFGMAEGSHFLALELVDGLDLKGLLSALGRQGEALTSGLVSYLALELATALDYAHDATDEGRVRGVVHRDISTSNVLVSKAGEVKLTDFGIAKAMNQPGTTGTGTIRGKVPYMAPEYARHGHFDARSDLFSLGVTLYECLAGQRPFDGTTDLDTLERIAQGRHRRLDERLPEAPTGLTETIERLIDPDPEKRFPHAAALLDALVDVAPPPTARRILGELVRTHVQGNPPQGLPSAAPPDEDASLALGETHPAPAEATALHTEAARAAPPALPQVDSAPTGDPTRTRAPLASEAPATELDARTTDRNGSDGGAGPPPNATAPEPDAPEPGPSAQPLYTAARHRRSGRLVLAASLGAALLALGGWLLWPASRDASPTAGDANAAPGEQAAQTSGPGPSAPGPSDPLPGKAESAPAEPELPSGLQAPAPGSDADTRTDARPAPRRGTLRVVVVPFGEVWIDGRRVGQSPVRRELAPGRHAVATGQDGRTQRRVVHLEPGGHQRVVLRRD